MIVKFLSHLRTITGCHETIIPLSKPISSEELWSELIMKFPELKAMRPSVRFAKNHEYVGSDSTFSNADEVALIPPVSGG